MMAPEGVDSIDSITLTFEDGKMAALHANMMASTDREGVIFGDKGYLEVQNINNPEEIRVFDGGGRLTARYPVPEQINGYEYEALACASAMAQGKTECEEMPHKEILRVMELLDGIRAEWGMKLAEELRTETAGK